MANYCTETDVMNLMPQLPRNTQQGYTQTSALIDLCISESESEIDSYLANRYTLPFSANAIPAQVRTIAKQLSVYRTYNYLYSSDNVNRNTYAERYESFKDNAYTTLKEIRDGSIRLMLTSGSIVPFKSSMVGVRGSHEDYQPVFDMDDALDWKVDADLLSDIRDKRR
jgi:phage gp36-like protein